ncbi:MAG: rSAM/selenodomain-associated transferase 2 [Cryomorphaceae bacterium]
MRNVNNSLSHQTSHALGLSVIVPILNEIEVVSDLVSNLRSLNAEQIIFVDGGSKDGTCEWLMENCKSEDTLLIQSKPGRALQMNAGAALASHEMLLFVHADTRLPLEAKTEICRVDRARIHWGRFDVCFDSNSTAMRVIAEFMNWRSRLTRVATGDHGIYMHRSLFDGVDGFDQIELMEDVAMTKKLRRILWPHCSKKCVTTSARRWQKNGVVKTVLQMWLLRLGYFVGISPKSLSKMYRNVR